MGGGGNRTEPGDGAYPWDCEPVPWPEYIANCKELLTEAGRKNLCEMKTWQPGHPSQGGRINYSKVASDQFKDAHRITRELHDRRNSGPR